MKKRPPLDRHVSKISKVRWIEDAIHFGARGCTKRFTVRCAAVTLCPGRYHDIVKQMCSGPVIAMEVRQENAVDAYRALVGPHDPEIARHLRPQTIRGQFGPAL